MSNDTQIAALTPADEHELEQWDRVARLAPTTGRVVLHSDVYLKLRAAVEASARQLSEQPGFVMVPDGVLTLEERTVRRDFAAFVQCQPCELLDPDATCPQCPGWLKTLDEQQIEDCFQEAAGADEETHIRFANAVINKFCEMNRLPLLAARPLTASPTAPSTDASEPVGERAIQRAEVVSAPGSAITVTKLHLTQAGSDSLTANSDGIKDLAPVRDERADFEAWRATAPWYTTASAFSEDNEETGCTLRLMNLAASEAWQARALKGTP